MADSTAWEGPKAGEIYDSQGNDGPNRAGQRRIVGTRGLMDVIFGRSKDRLSCLPGVLTHGLAAYNKRNLFCHAALRHENDGSCGQKVAANLPQVRRLFRDAEFQK